MVNQTDPPNSAPLLGPLTTIKVSLRTLLACAVCVALASTAWYKLQSSLEAHERALNRVAVQLEQLKARLNNLERQLQRLTPRGQGWHNRDKILTYGVKPAPYNSLNRTETTAEWHTCLRVVVTQPKVIHPNCMYVLGANGHYWVV